MKKIYTAFVEYDDESKLYVGIVPNVRAPVHRRKPWTNCNAICRKCWSFAWRKILSLRTKLYTSWVPSR
jgi:hypothetical protein